MPKLMAVAFTETEKNPWDEWSGSVEEARDKCAMEPLCEVVCYHKKTGKTQFYSHFEKALKEVERGAKGWNEVLQKGPSHYEKDWACFRTTPTCRKEATKAAEATEKEGKERVETELEKLAWLQRGLSRPPPPPFQAQGSLSGDSATFLGEMGFPSGEKAAELWSTCSSIASQVARAEGIHKAPSVCPNKLFVHRTANEDGDLWQQCCEVPAEPDPQHPDEPSPKPPRLTCTNAWAGLCDGKCSHSDGVCLGLPGSYGDTCIGWGAAGEFDNGEGARVVELKSASLPVPFLAVASWFRMTEKRRGCSRVARHESGRFL
eukprot:TRINITY_DN20923_c0_g3_i1.p1 TRINITY_DN20923_c0_g3~~TRINITY_DN20923_c0_g3_i1.p1  ORF type:complete len:318 (+),score=54.98 TRINITY_DN20923_c0_g3_i1:85-1038(+)